MLEIENLSHTYANGTVALDDVSLSIPRGMFGLLGPNGAGKSTLMRTVATLQEPTAGTINFGDIDVLAEPRAAAAHARLPAAGFRRLSARFGLCDARPHGGAQGHHRRRRAQGGGRDPAQPDQPVGRAQQGVAGFSGGMRQRFGIAQALIGNPELIIVDEPTAGLDPEERNRFLNLLAEIGENVVVILSTHIVDDVADLCPRMAVLANGRVQLEGKPADLIASTRGKVWRKTIDHAELERLPGQRYEVISTRLFAGNTIIHVLSDTQPAGLRPGRGRARGRLFLDPLHPPPRGLRGARRCSSESPASKSATSSATRSSGSRSRSSSCSASGSPRARTSASARPARSTRTRRSRSPSRPAVFSLFYLFVITAFVANAIVRDDSSGFAPIVRATRSPNRQI